MISTRGRKILGAFPFNADIAVCLALFCFSVTPPAAWCGKKPEKILTTANGNPVRKVFIRSATPDMASSAATEITQDTCLTTVPDSKQADAVLDVGIALPGLGGGGGSTPDVFGPSAHPQTLGNDKSKPQRSVSATCSDGKTSGGCTSSYSGPRGGIVQPSAEWPGNVGTQLDVSLTQPGNTSQELWEPTGDKKKSWSDQLRQAAGCPVCPGEHFNRRKYQTYRNWIQAKCPAVLAAH